MTELPISIARCKHGTMRYLANDAVIGRSLELYGEFSDRETGFLERLLAPGAVVIEVGANVGAHTVPLAKRVGPEGRIYAIEPQALIADLLGMNLRENGCANVTVLRAAAGRERGHGRLPKIDYFDAGGNFGGATLCGSADGEEVAVMPLDELAEEARVDLVKIDVEGFEAEVIRGAETLIACHRPLLYVENDREAKSAELIRLIQSLGYRLWWHLPPLFDERNFRGSQRNEFRHMVSVNMLCVPAEVPVKLAGLREIRDPEERWQAATRPYERERQPRAEGEKSAAVLRPGVYGDCLMASSVIAGLKAEGYHVTVYTEGPGEEIFREDPNVDRLLWLPREEVTIADICGYFFGEASQYDRSVSLVEVVEKNLLAIASDVRFYWPQPARAAAFGGNYLEALHRVAGVPHRPAVRFHPSAVERAEAALWASGHGPFALIAASGSTAPKYWPHLPRLVPALLERGLQVVVAGDLRGLALAPRPGLHVLGTARPMREVLALAQQADVVIGQETGILNAVAFEEGVRKVVLLSHSSRENLTRDWPNTVALAGAVACYPCHRNHTVEVGSRYCTQDAASGAAACQAAISVVDVLSALGADLLKEAA